MVILNMCTADTDTAMHLDIIIEEDIGIGAIHLTTIVPTTIVPIIMVIREMATSAPIMAIMDTPTIGVGMDLDFTFTLAGKFKLGIYYPEGCEGENLLAKAPCLS